MNQFIPCTVKQLPEHLQSDAEHTIARLAVVPSNLTVLLAKSWGSGGAKLTVSFMDGPSTALKAKILAYANKWSKYCNFSFVETAGNGQVRVARTPGQGYYSFMGKDILSIPANQPTLNLDSFTMQTPDSEFDRVVTHEFGHSMGFPHEHARAEVIALLDVAKVIAYFEATQGWSQSDIYQQILTPLNPNTFRGTAAPDTSSVMCYSFPGSLTLNGQPILGGNGIDATDGAFAATVYPLAVQPPVPPPQPPIGTVKLTLSGDVKAGTYTLGA